MLKDSVQFRIVLKSLRMDVQSALKTIKSTRMASVHHTIQTVSPETFTTSVLAAKMVTTSTHLSAAEHQIWAAITLMVFAHHARLHSFIKDKLPLVSLMAARNISSEDVKSATNHTNLDTIHVNLKIVCCQARESVSNATQTS